MLKARRTLCPQHALESLQSLTESAQGKITLWKISSNLSCDVCANSDDQCPGCGNNDSYNLTDGCSHADGCGFFRGLLETEHEPQLTGFKLTQ